SIQGGDQPGRGGNTFLAVSGTRFQPRRRIALERGRYRVRDGYTEGSILRVLLRRCVDLGIKEIRRSVLSIKCERPSQSEWQLATMHHQYDGRTAEHDHSQREQLAVIVYRRQGYS